MPRPSQRTRSKKRVHKTLPGGRTTTQFKQKVTTGPHCSLCGRPIAGSPHSGESATSKLSRSKRRVHRPYGKQLCSRCLKNAIRERARNY